MQTNKVLHSYMQLETTTTCRNNTTTVSKYMCFVCVDVCLRSSFLCRDEELLKIIAQLKFGEVLSSRPQVNTEAETAGIFFFFFFCSLPPHPPRERLHTVTVKLSPL